MACFARVEAIQDPLERRYALLHEAERLGIRFQDLTTLLADYALSRRTRRGTLERWLYRLASWFEEHSFFEVLEYVGRLAIIIAILSFFAGLPEDRARRRIQRWEAVKAAAGDAYDSNRLESLQTLDRACFPMEGLEAPQAELAGIRLDGCYTTLGGITWGSGLLSRIPGLYRYRGARLRGSDLAAANLAGAGLRGAVLSGASLAGATSPAPTWPAPT